MSISRLQQRLDLSRPLTGTEKQDLYDLANRSADPKTVGKERLRKWAIACRPVMGQWDNNDQVIINARFGHDQGWGVMFTETTAEWVVLYYCPHLHRVRRRPYFNTGVSNDTDA